MSDTNAVIGFYIVDLHSSISLSTRRPHNSCWSYIISIQ